MTKKIILPVRSDRGLVGRVMDAAQSHYGDGKPMTEFWDPFFQGVVFALRAIKDNPGVCAAPHKD